MRKPLDKLKRAYIAYLKQLAANSEYRRKNKEKIKAYKAELYMNPEYKEKLSEYRKKQYYIKRYGMTKEEYLKIKAEKNEEFLERFINGNDKKTRFLSFEQFSTKYDFPKIFNL